MATKPKTEENVEDLGDESPLASRMGSMLGGGGATSLAGINMSNVSSGTELLPENIDIHFVITKCEAAKSTTGNSMLKISLKADEAGVAAVTVPDYVVYSGDNPWKFKSLCQATGTLSDDGSTFTGSGERDFIGKTIVARVQHDVYQGDKKNKIKGAYKVPTGDDDGGGDEPDFNS